MTPANEQTQSDEQQAVMLEYLKETASGGTPSAQLIDKLNSAELRVGNKKFQAVRMATILNRNALNARAWNEQIYKQYGMSFSEAPDYVQHPMMKKAVAVPDPFNSVDWVCVDDKPYQPVGA